MSSETERLLVGDLRALLKDLPSKTAVELHVVDSTTGIKMAGRLDFHSKEKDYTLRLYAVAEYLGGMS